MAVIRSAGIVPVKSEKEQYKFLMLRRNDYYDFAKGKLEPNEEYIDAAIRETAEETALTNLNFKWDFCFTETLPYKTKDKEKKRTKIARYYVAEVLSGEPCIIPNPETGKCEHDEFMWLTYDEACQLPLRKRIRKVLDWANSTIN
jgi:8-oxo-dGTP pyrophosphatase MutT (NUDIX family)